MKNKFKLSVPFVLAFLAIIITTSSYATAISYASTKHNGITIVLDAGHGGRDGGSVGVNGTVEKDINLSYTLALKEKLTQNNFKVQLTRQNDNGLYSPTAHNKKLSDMNARLKIIENTNPALVVSVHMNSFTSKEAHGATTYYRKGDTHGETCANLIQKSLHTYCSAPMENAKIGDYFILNCNHYTAVLIECGFLSNPEEEMLLNSNNYKEDIVEAIYKGILLYFG